MNSTFDVRSLGEGVSGFTIYAKGSSGAFDRALEEDPALPSISGRNTKVVEVDLEVGSYEMSCEPEEEEGPRVPITVTAEGPTEGPTEAPGEPVEPTPTVTALS